VITAEFTNAENGKKTLFELKLEELGIEYMRTRPYSSWQNEKVERSHRLEELRRSVKRYCSRYNNISRKVLNFKSPNEMLKE